MLINLKEKNMFAFFNNELPVVTFIYGELPFSELQLIAYTSKDPNRSINTYIQNLINEDHEVNLSAKTYSLKTMEDPFLFDKKSYKSMLRSPYNEIIKVADELHCRANSTFYADYITLLYDTVNQLVLF